MTDETPLYGINMSKCLIKEWIGLRFFNWLSADNHAAAAAAKSPQSCPTLCDPIDGSPPGSPVPGILQARTLEWVAISFSNAWKWKVKVKSFSCAWLLATPWTAAYQAPHWGILIQLLFHDAVPGRQETLNRCWLYLNVQKSIEQSKLTQTARQEIGWMSREFLRERKKSRSQQRKHYRQRSEVRKISSNYRISG